VKRELEALLFATDAPLGVGRLRGLFADAELKEIKAAVAALQQEYEDAGFAFTIVEFGGGYQIATRPEYAPLVERLYKGRRYARLSRAGLEVLAIVAYRQPITRLEIDEIRGVQSSGAIATLTERNLLTVVGRSEAVGHPMLYGTTREFLSHLGLKGLTQLPALPNVEQAVQDPEELKAFASRFGADLTEEDLTEVPEAAAVAATEPAAATAEVEPPEPIAELRSAHRADPTDDAAADEDESR
jgi:segregation and condensation protein B